MSTQRSFLRQLALKFSFCQLICCLILAMTAVSCRPAADVMERVGDREAAATTGPAPRLLVVDNPPLATAIQREWQARSGVALPLETMTRAEWRDAVEQDRLAADAVIYPSTDLGALAEANSILPAPKYISDPASALAESDILPLIRREIRWGQTLCAIPFGSAPLLLVYRTDVLAEMGAAPPRTWRELHRLAGRLSEQQHQQALPARIESVLYQPLADGWAAKLLIARAAAYLRDAARYSDLWQVITMEPLISTPPFVRALEELAADQGLATPADLRLRPDQVFEAVRGGKCVLGIGCWPTGDPEQDADYSSQLGFALLPGAAEQFQSPEVTDPHGTWVPRPAIQRVPVLAAGGYVGSVLRGTRRQRAAWNLLVQLAAPDWGDSVCAAGRGAAPFRGSHLKQIHLWLAGIYDDQSMEQYRNVVETYYTSDLHLPMLRIPGGAEFLQELDAAVRAVTSGATDAGSALATATQAWRERLSDSDREALSMAYLRQLGIERWPQ